MFNWTCCTVNALANDLPQHINFEVLLNVNTRYCIWFDAVGNGLTILVCILGSNDYSNKRVENQVKFCGPLWIGPIHLWAVLLMSLATSRAIATSLSTSLHISSYVIIAIHITVKSTATSSFMSPLCDVTIESVTKIILFVTLIFVIENGLGLGFGSPGTFHDGFKTSWIKQSMTKI